MWLLIHAVRISALQSVLTTQITTICITQHGSNPHLPTPWWNIFMLATARYEYKCRHYRHGTGNKVTNEVLYRPEQIVCCYNLNAPLARHVKSWVAHASGMPGTFSPQPPFSDPDIHHGTCVRHVPWCMPGSLTSGFLWSRRRGKRSRHSRRMRNVQFYLSSKRPIRHIQT